MRSVREIIMKIQINKLRIAHRGLHDANIPENSMAAFRKCIDNKIPIELDVHLLKDGHLAVFHDDNLKRMTGIDRDIHDMTKEDLNSIRLLGTEETIPMLEDVLKVVSGKVILDIEVKTLRGSSLEVCKRVAEALDDYSGPFFVKSFNPFYVAWFRFFRPNYQRGLLVSKLRSAKMSRIVKFLLYHMTFNFLCAPDFLALSKDDFSKKRIEKLRKKYPILLWVVRNEETLYDGAIYESDV